MAGGLYGSHRRNCGAKILRLIDSIIFSVQFSERYGFLLWHVWSFFSSSPPSLISVVVYNVFPLQRVRMVRVILYIYVYTFASPIRTVF